LKDLIHGTPNLHDIKFCLSKGY